MPEESHHLLVLSFTVTFTADDMIDCLRRRNEKRSVQVFRPSFSMSGNEFVYD